MMKPFLLSLALCLGAIHCSVAQTADTAKNGKENIVHPYFIITAGTTINAYFRDKPLSIETISDFNQYVQANVKSLKDSWVVVSGKPKIGTFDEVLKTLSHYRIKHVTTNIIKD